LVRLATLISASRIAVIARFNHLTYDSARRLLLDDDGQPLHLTPKAFDLLSLLIERAPAVVTKDEIHGRLWPGVFVSDTTLVGLIKELRRVLQDHDPSSPIIRTAHRIGYALCEVERGAERRLTAAAHWIVDAHRRISLHEGENVVGRDPRCDVWVDLAGVSRRHARILIQDARAEIEDLGSKNGTSVGNRQLTATSVLRDGDAIDVGPARLMYRFSEAGASTETTADRRQEH
jgi:DNA-binding winged helix-turn-helix (wHTH) protein